MSESAQYCSESASETTETSSASSKASQLTAQVDQEGDAETSPIDMECNIQADRITKCLDKLVYQTKLALCIPTLLHDNILAGILTPRHLDDVAITIDEYEYPLSADSNLNMSAVEDIQGGDFSIKNRVNPELSCLMCTLSSYPAIKPHVEKITEKIKNELQSSRTNTEKKPHGRRVLPGVQHLLKLEKFRDLMVQRMRTTAAEEMSAIIHTRKLEESNNKSLEKISEYTKCLKEEKKTHDDEIRRKQEIIAQLKRQLKVNEQKTFVERQKQILDSERQMVLATRAHRVKYQILKEEEVESRELYDKSIIDNMQAEKQLRDRRRKAETQLLSWLQKYDVEMSAKQEELDDITKQYDDEVQKGQDLQLKLEEQDKEFYPLMTEKEEEYHQEMTAKLNDFIIEHAARVIQYAWRTTLKNRDEKKKLLKLKKKMEAEREAAARKAEIEAKKQELLRKKQAAKEKAEAKAAAKAAKLEAKADQGKRENEEGK